MGSQYTNRALGLMGSTSFMERSYDDTAHTEAAGNKANFESPYPPEQPKIERGERFFADESTIGNSV